MMPAALLLAPGAVSLIVCWLMIRLGPKDAPDGLRKMQGAPIPSSGGIGILAGLAAGAAVLAAFGAPVAGLLCAAPLAGIAVFAVFAALLGWYDDAAGMPALPKLLALLGASVIAAQLGPDLKHLWFGGEGLALAGFSGLVIVTAWIFVMANAVNFMDGANGIAMGTALIILVMLSFLLVPVSVFSEDRAAPRLMISLLFAAAAAIAGFLFWNLKGRLFAGDAGSLFVGGLIGGASAMFAMDGPVLAPLTLSLPILIDVFLTLAWRAKHGRPLMKAHRDHAYQLLLRSGWSHARVARLWWGLTVVCAGAVVAGPFAAAVGAYDAGGLPLDVIVFAVLLVCGCALWVRQRVMMGRGLAT